MAERIDNGMIQRIGKILFWSVIAAAFIGPGTVTTAVSAGATAGYGLLWALVFSTVACFILQEAAARLPILRDQSLGEALARQFGNNHTVRIAIAGMVIMGCIAYEGGNLSGANLGIGLLAGEALAWPLLLMGAIAALLLYTLSYQWLARVLGIMVAGMGLFFFWLLWQLPIDWAAVAKAAVTPDFGGSTVMVLGLVGTTIVPYNLFLGSGISREKDLGGMRLGLAVAIGLGGLLSMALLLTGAQLSSNKEVLEGLHQLLSREYGMVGRYILPLGLLAAGFTSTITAPFAAAITAGSVSGSTDPAWSDRGPFFRIIWGVVLGFGLLMSLLGMKPVPLIIMAQAFNGLLLPVVGIFLYRIINQPGREGRNPLWLNVLMGIIVWVTTLLGLRSLVNGLRSIPGMDFPLGESLSYLLAGIALLITLFGLFWKRSK